MPALFSQQNLPINYLLLITEIFKAVSWYGILFDALAPQKAAIGHFLALKIRIAPEPGLESLENGETFAW